MTKYATMNPLGSTSPYDLFDNAQNFDIAINSITAAIWQDRFGKSRHTWYGLEAMAKAAIAAFGYITMDSFQVGATITLPNQVLRWKLPDGDGDYYRWDGAFPKWVPPGSTPENAGGVGSGKWLSVGDATLRADLAKPSGPKLIGGLPFDSLYGDLSTSSDNTAAINERLNWSRTTGKTVEFPAGRFPVSGSLELGGVKARGRSVGYRNSDGTVLVGSGQAAMFKQSQATFPYYAATSLESLKIENVVCGLDFGYLTRALFEDIHIDSTGTSIRFGDATQAGPLFNVMRRCSALSDGGSALYINGATWCNDNIFELCFFESKNNGLSPAVVIDTAGGLGAIGNLFPGTEIASEGYGVRLKNARATDFSATWFECMGPAIWLNGTSYGTIIAGAVFGRQRASNITGIPWAIYHESGNATLAINKPYISLTNPADQDGCGLIGYAGTSPAAGLVVDVVSDPHTENTGGVAYTRYKDGLFSKVTKILHGDQIIQSDSSPSLALQYEDGTKKFEVYSNSSKGGADVGVVMKVNDVARLQFTTDNKVLLPGQKLGLVGEANTSAPGTKTHRIQVLSETGAFLGYLAVYSS